MDKLVVWFHGNGEGDLLGSRNNVAQMLANRGTVAWASEEFQNILGGAHVMAFQAPDTWYYAQRDGLLDIAANEINAVIRQYGIDREKILQALTKVRGSQRVTSQNPEESYEALAKYGRDLVDMARQGKRQIGSTIKPFVYTFAIDHLGMTPCTMVPNLPVTIETANGRRGRPRRRARWSRTANSTRSRGVWPAAATTTRRGS